MRAMECIRVLVGARPGLLRDIVVEAVSAQPDMELIGVDSDASPWQRQVAPPDVFIVCARDPDDSTAADEVFAHWPRCRTLIVALSGRHTVMYELRPHKQALREVSIEELITVIRGRQDLLPDAVH